MNARSECVAPSTFGFAGGVVEIMRMFHAASPASQTPAFKPTRGSGDGAVPDTIGSTGFGMSAGGGPNAGAAGAAPRPRPPRPAASAAGAAAAPAAGAGAGAAAAGAGAGAAAVGAGALGVVA